MGRGPPPTGEVLVLVSIARCPPPPPGKRCRGHCSCSCSGPPISVIRGLSRIRRILAKRRIPDYGLHGHVSAAGADRCSHSYNRRGGDDQKAPPGVPSLSSGALAALQSFARQPTPWPRRCQIASTASADVRSH